MNCLINISEATSLALHATIYLKAHNNRNVSTKEIAEEFDASEAHLAKVMQRLVKSGLIRSIRGPKGGFSLEKSGDEVSLFQLYELFDGPLPENNCLFHKPSCNLELCVFDDFLCSINKQIFDYMKNANLSELASMYLKGMRKKKQNRQSKQLIKQ
jgi:Rrf2 family protein